MSFKIVRFNCCGMDVHKNIIVATIGITDRNTLITEYHQKSFSSLNSDLFKLCDWLDSFGCKDVCMESTGKYWIPIYNILEERGFTICLAHPKYTKAIKNQKTDKRDSMWICDLFKHDLVRGSFIPPKEIRELREISRYYHKLVAMNSSESNRFQNCLTVSNLGIGSIFTDTNGKSARKVVEAVLTADDPNVITDEDLARLVHKNCKNTDKLLDAIHGCRIESDTRFKMEEISKHKEELDLHITSCYLELVKRASVFFSQFLHITEIKGISFLSAILIISEIGVDMSVWTDSRQLCAWAGLVPGKNESANKKKSTRITKAGLYLKPLLVQCALASIKDKNSYFGIKYSRIKKRRGHKKAIVAIARMMLTSIYNMILTGESFNPTDYKELMNPKPKSPKITIDQAVEFLKTSGADLDQIIANLKNPVTANILPSG